MAYGWFVVEPFWEFLWWMVPLPAPERAAWVHAEVYRAAARRCSLQR